MPVLLSMPFPLHFQGGKLPLEFLWYQPFLHQGRWILLQNLLAVMACQRPWESYWYTHRQQSKMTDNIPESQSVTSWSVEILSLKVNLQLISLQLPSQPRAEREIWYKSCVSCCLQTTAFCIYNVQGMTGLVDSRCLRKCVWLWAGKGDVSRILSYTLMPQFYQKAKSKYPTQLATVGSNGPTERKYCGEDFWGNAARGVERANSIVWVGGELKM